MPAPPETLESPVHGGVKQGDVLAGKYRVERILGEGGMGVVVAAHHIQLDERVALKFLLPRALRNPEAVGRFSREARAAVKIKSEHVARVTDVGELESGAPYIVMEYLEGSDLAAWLTEKGPLPIQRAVGFVLETCEALAEAHRLGIVHRDLKPANLFLANRPSGAPIIKVLDFGISKSSFTASEQQLTKTASVMGSPLYMSPEQMESAKTVDVRSDIWALGVVLYELMGGKVPFQGDTMPELVVAVLQRKHEPLRGLCPEVPEALEEAVNRCLAKQPADRFPDVLALAKALSPFGPPQSGVSLERISHVFGGGEATDGKERTRHEVRTGSIVSPNASTVPADVAPPFDGATLPAGAVAPSPSPPGAATTAKAVSSTTPPTSPQKRSWSIPVAGAMAVASMLGFLAWRGTMSTHAAAAPTAPVATVPITKASEPAPSDTPPAPPASVEKAPARTAPTAEAASARPATSATTKAATAPAGNARAPMATPSVKPPAASAPLVKANCNPPYVVDQDGHHIYKPECN